MGRPSAPEKLQERKLLDRVLKSKGTQLGFVYSIGCIYLQNPPTLNKIDDY